MRKSRSDTKVASSRRASSPKFPPSHPKTPRLRRCLSCQALSFQPRRWRGRFLPRDIPPPLGPAVPSCLHPGPGFFFGWEGTSSRFVRAGPAPPTLPAARALIAHPLPFRGRQGGEGVRVMSTGYLVPFSCPIVTGPYQCKRLTDITNMITEQKSPTETARLEKTRRGSVVFEGAGELSSWFYHFALFQPPRSATHLPGSVEDF